MGVGSGRGRGIRTGGQESETRREAGERGARESQTYDNGRVPALDSGVLVVFGATNGCLASLDWVDFSLARWRRRDGDKDGGGDGRRRGVIGKLVPGRAGR